jgi:short-subunit dehydrogenase
MKALITGASSGIGKEMAKILSHKGYDLILVARRKKRLEELKKELPTKVKIITLDISSTFNCMKLKKEDIDIIINNAGFGLLGEFSETNIDKELDMIDTNIKAVHILTKLFLQDFILRDKGYILNVSSSASFLAGPLMSTYYATKNYVSRLTEAIYEELRRKKSNVYVGLLCPGPVDTEFNEVANVKFSLKGQSSEYVAKYAIDQMFKRKLIIIPGFKMKFICSMNKFVPKKLLLKITYNIQKKKDV